MEYSFQQNKDNDPFGQNDDGNDEKSFLKALLAERALKNGLDHPVEDA